MTLRACELFAGGASVEAIREALASQFGDTGLTREGVFPLVAHAAANGWLRHRAPPELALERSLKRRYPWLSNVRVAHSAVLGDVATLAAEAILDLTQTPAVSGDGTVKIGFSGGWTCSKVASRLATLLAEQGTRDEIQIEVMALTAGIDCTAPERDPNMFLGTFLRTRVRKAARSAYALRAPGIVQRDQLGELKRLRGIQQALARARDLRIVVHGLAVWEEDSVLRKHLMERAPAAGRAVLDDALYDVLWQPVGPDGPLSDLPVQAFTLLQLSELGERIRDGLRVVMAIGPSTDGSRSKAPSVASALELRLASDLVIDSWTARDVLALDSGAEQVAANVGMRDEKETLSIVAHLFCRGHRHAEIARIMTEEYGVQMKQSRPYQLVSKALSDYRMEFIPPRDFALWRRMATTYDWLSVVDVVDAANPTDSVAASGAAALLRLVSSFDKEEVHVALSGGHTIRRVARLFADRLRDPATRSDLPATLVFHALNAGIEPGIETDATAFFALMVGDGPLPIQMRFVAMNAPGVVYTHKYEELKTAGGIQDALDRRSEIDIIVTSGAVWGCHSTLEAHYEEQSSNTHAWLTKGGCVGDLLWRPVRENGPMDDRDTEIRAISLFELGELPGFIDSGGRVLLVLGPCGYGMPRCGKSKGRLLRAVLDAREHLITDLVVDIESASESLRLSPRREGGIAARECTERR